jgi:TolB-like protein
MVHRRTMFQTAIWAGVLLCVVDRPVAAQDFSRIAPTIAARLASTGRKTVAVVDFTDLQMNVTELGRFLAEEFQGALVNQAQGFRVVDRTHLKALLQENKLAASGIIDPQTARQLGRIAGVDALVTGGITPLGDSVRLSIKLLDVSSAEVIAMSSIDVPKTAAIAVLSDQAITSSGSAATGVASSRAASSSSPSQLSTSMGDVQLDLLSCQRAAMTVKCEFRVTNNGPDRDVEFGGRRENGTRAYDDAGVMHQLTTIDLARRHDDYNETLARGRLISKVPTSLVVTFNQVDASARIFSALYIGGEMGTSSFYNGREAIIRNVPIR